MHAERSDIDAERAVIWVRHKPKYGWEAKTAVSSVRPTTYQAIESVNASAFYGTYVSSSRSGSIGVEKSLELHQRTQS